MIHGYLGLNITTTCLGIGAYTTPPFYCQINNIFENFTPPIWTTLISTSNTKLPLMGQPRLQDKYFSRWGILLALLDGMLRGEPLNSITLIWDLVCIFFCPLIQCLLSKNKCSYRFDPEAMIIIKKYILYEVKKTISLKILEQSRDSLVSLFGNLGEPRRI